VTPDGKRFANSYHEHIQFVELDSGTVLWKQDVGEDIVRDIVFTPDANHLIAGDSCGRLEMLRTADGKKVAQWRHGDETKGPLDGVQALVVSPDGKYLASAGWAEPVKIWKISTQKLVSELIGLKQEKWCLALAPDGTTLGAADDYNEFMIWENIWPKSDPRFKSQVQRKLA
jgi:WD40 repeat protein